MENKKMLNMGDLPERLQEKLRIMKKTMIRMSDIPDPGTRKNLETMYQVNRKIGDVLQDGEWKGQRCFIIAGGESVKDFDLKKLEGEHAIGINLAFRLFEPEIIYCVDARLWGWIESGDTGPEDRDKFNASKAIKVWSDITPAPMPEDIVIAPNIGRPGLSHSFKEGVGVGTNSGFGAINLALLMGASEIYLIGYDFYGERWHKGYPQSGEAGNDFHRVCYEETSVEFKEFPSRIINLNLKSKLNVFEFGEMPKDLKPIDKTPSKEKRTSEPIFVCYYTADNGYKTYADNLKKTLDRLNLDYDIQPVKNRGNWDANTKIKPEFIIQMLDRHPTRDVIWLDADSVVVSLPEKLLHCKSDFACRIRETGELITSVMFFANNGTSRNLLRDVQKIIATGEIRSFGEQKFFEEVIKKLRKTNTFKFENLPESYCTIMGISKMDEEAVIEQHQASRDLKT